MDGLTLNEIACALAKRMKKGRWGCLPEDVEARLLHRAEQKIKEWSRVSGRVHKFKFDYDAEEE